MMAHLTAQQSDRNKYKGCEKVLIEVVIQSTLSQGFLTTLGKML